MEEETKQCGIVVLGVILSFFILLKGCQIEKYHSYRMKQLEIQCE